VTPDGHQWCVRVTGGGRPATGDVPDCVDAHVETDRLEFVHEALARQPVGVAPREDRPAPPRVGVDTAESRVLLDVTTEAFRTDVHV